MRKRATDQEVRQAFRRFADASVETGYAFLRQVRVRIRFRVRG